MFDAVVGVGALRAIVGVLQMILDLSVMLILLRVVLSWLRPDRANPLVHAIYKVTDPPLNWTRRTFPFLARGGIDFSPIALVLLIGLFSQTVLGTIAGAGSLPGNLVRGLGAIISSALFLGVLLFLARGVMILVDADPYTALYQAIFRLTHPLEYWLVNRLTPKPPRNGNGNGGDYGLGDNIRVLRPPRGKPSPGLITAAPWVWLVVFIVLFGLASNLIGYFADHFDALAR